MKKSDIKVGSEYAYNRHESGAAQRVKVLGEADIRQGYGYNAKTVTGSQVQVLESRTGEPAERPGGGGEWIINVANRTLREPWAEYAERVAAQAKARRATQERRAVARSERAEFLLGLIPALRNAGFPDTEEHVYDNETVEALRVHMADDIRFESEGFRKGWLFKAPLARALGKYVQDGSAIPVPAADLLLVLHGRAVR